MTTTTSTPTRPRIDRLTPGTPVTLLFTGEDRIGSALFLGITGDGDKRHAHFVSTSTTGDLGVARTYTWEAYRYRGAWAYGTSADRLTLVEALDVPRG